MGEVNALLKFVALVANSQNAVAAGNVQVADLSVILGDFFVAKLLGSAVGRVVHDFDEYWQQAFYSLADF